MSYDRELLLYGEKRNAVLGLREVQRYGTDSYDDPDYVCVYGMRPAQWHETSAPQLVRARQYHRQLAPGHRRCG